MKIKYLIWIPVAFAAIVIGLYPLIYFLVDMHDKGIFKSKPTELLRDSIWHTFFYIHISFGGIALLTGWTQFSKRLRARYLNTHRFVGKIYLIAVLLSSAAGLYIAYYATGGIICTLGFGILAIIWMYTAIKAYTSIRALNIEEHKNWMTRNYALTFAAVNLRVYLPLLTMFVFNHDFIPGYRIVSWLAWVPNLIIAEMIIRKKQTTKLEQDKMIYS
jgi:uncharacterized membrane protein